MRGGAGLDAGSWGRLLAAAVTRGTALQWLRSFVPGPSRIAPLPVGANFWHRSFVEGSRDCRAVLSVRVSNAR